MERFTRKVNEEDLPMGFGGDNYRFTDEYIFGENPNSPTDKLGQLEDLEEELGIDLINLFKVLKEGVYTIHSNGKKIYPCLAYNGAVGYILDFIFEQEAQYILSDYGKTWALDWSELEND